MPPKQFCSHLRQDGQIDLPTSPDCHIFIGVSKNAHLVLLFSLEHVEGCLLKPILVFISYINKELSASET